MQQDVLADPHRPVDVEGDPGEHVLQQFAQLQGWCHRKDGVLCPVGLQDLAAWVRFGVALPLLFLKQCAGQDRQQCGLELVAECDAGGHHGSL